MTRRDSLIVLLIAAAVAAGMSGCTSPDPEEQTQVAAPLTAADAVRQVVKTYIWENTAEGAPYFIGSVPTQFVRFGREVALKEKRATCTAHFASSNAEYLVEYVLERDPQTFVITQILLKKAGAEDVEEVLYDRASFVR